MDTDYLGNKSKNTDWEEASKVALPTNLIVKNNTATSKLPIKDMSINSSQSIPLFKESKNLINKISVNLKKNSVTESKINFIEKQNKLLADKNIFLQDQFLILKEKYQNINKKNIQFVKNLNINSQKIHEFKNQLYLLKTELINTQNTKKHTVDLNRYLQQRLTKALKQHQKITKQNNTVHNKVITENQHDISVKKMSLKHNQLIKEIQNNQKHNLEQYKTQNQEIIEEQKQHIASLQKINRQLSRQYINDTKLQSSEHIKSQTPQYSVKTSIKKHIVHILKDIRFYNKSL